MRRMPPRLAALRSNLTRVIAVLVVLALVVAAAVWYAFLRPSGRTITAFFDQTIGIYSGSDVRVLGVKVGTIDSILPMGSTVKVVMHVDDGVDVPADAKAAVIAPSLVSGRYIQLVPAYTGGPKMADGAVIPQSRTAVPVELDQVYASLDTLSRALGPQGANRTGALSDLINVGAANLAGNGQLLNTTIGDLSRAVGTLSDNRQDLFGTVDNLQRFVSTLAASDAQVRALNSQLTDVAGFLAAERTNLSSALAQLSVALTEVAAFVRDNRDLLRTDVGKLASISDILVQQRAALTEVLDVAPAALGNLSNAYNPASATLDVRPDLNELANPGLLVCKLVNGPDGLGVHAPPELVSACADLVKKLGGALPAVNPAQILSQLQRGQLPMIPGVTAPVPGTPLGGGG